MSSPTILSIADEVVERIRVDAKRLEDAIVKTSLIHDCGLLQYACGRQ